MGDLFTCEITSQPLTNQIRENTFLGPENGGFGQCPEFSQSMFMAD